jgi:hypothetical protein
VKMGTNRIDTRYIRELEHAVARLINFGRTAEGGILPPPQVGANRVPQVKNLRCLHAKGITGGTEFTIAWDDAAIGKTSYIVHPYTATSLTAYNTLPPQTSQRSPATVRIIAGAGEVVMFRVQTVMGNGMASLLENSSSCTAKTL